MKSAYQKLFSIAVISIVVMYLILFFNIDKPKHFELSLDRLYLTLAIVCPIIWMFIITMRADFYKRWLNTAISLFTIVVFVGAIWALRTQKFIGDSQYLKALIPSHSAEIDMSKHATITDSHVKTLSEKVVKRNEEEIEEMKAILKRIDGGE